MLLDDSNGPCIIDDTPQFPESVGITIRSRAPGIRSNPAQAQLLKKAYKQSNVLSPEQAKILAEETGLPPKWILQWFSRQRSKERKNDVNYKPRSKPSILTDASTTRVNRASTPAAFSSMFFSDSGSGALGTGIVSAQEVMTIKSEYQDSGSLVSTPSASGSTSMEEFTPFPGSPSVSTSTSSGRLDVVAHEDAVIKISGTRRKKRQAGGKNRNTLHPGRRLKQTPNAQTKSNDGAAFSLLKLNSPGNIPYGLNFSDDAQSGMIEPDMDAYTRPSSLPPLQRGRVSPPSTPQNYLPHVVPPRRSPIVASDNAVRSTGKAIKTRHRPSRLSVVNVPVDEFDISLHQGNSFSVPISSAAETFSDNNVALSVSQTQRYNNRPSMSVPRAPGAEIAEPAPSSKYLVPNAGNRLSKADPLVTRVSGFPDFDELAFMDCADISSSLHQDNGLMYMGSASPERYGAVGPHPSTDGCYPPDINPEHLEALDPLRAPLKHLTGILTEYRDDDGTYFSLLVGLQDPVGRRKIIGCLSNEDLLLHDPFVAAMGLALLSRLGVL